MIVVIVVIDVIDVIVVIVVIVVTDVVVVDFYCVPGTNSSYCSLLLFFDNLQDFFEISDPSARGHQSRARRLFSVLESAAKSKKQKAKSKKQKAKSWREQ